MRDGWFFRDKDRKVLHRARRDGDPFVLGAVPRVTGTVLHLTDDGETIRIEYQIVGKRQRRRRIITEDELDRGTWAAKVGQGRPSSSDAKQAFATIIRSDAEQAPELMARPYYNEDGDLVLPDAEAQSFGYRVTAGPEGDARQTWDEIGAYAVLDPKAALVLGAMFLGPAYNAIDVHAHILNLVGPGQQGKSTMLTVACALLGDVAPRRQQIMGTWNSSKQGITQAMRARGFLPFGLDEHSTSGRKVQEAGREFSQMVGGAIRQMGTADGSPREVDGFWWSILLSTSNQWLRWQGQTEDLASRLYEIDGPFFPHTWVDAGGAPAEPGGGAAEHVSKRLKRLARSAGGWPLEWAVRGGAFKAENLRALKRTHLELCAKFCPRTGGIADTIAEIHMAWVVGALLLEKVLGVPGLGAAAECAAAELLGGAVVQAAEANLPDGERLWLALDSLRIEASAFPTMDKLRAVAEEGSRTVRGFIDPEAGEWWVNLPTVQQAAKTAEVENLSAALRHLDTIGVHIRGTGKNAQRLLPKPVRYAGLGERMHCFNTQKAAELWSPDEEGEKQPDGGGATQFPSGATPRSDPGATQVAPGSDPLTCGGATGATGATSLEMEFTYTPGATPEATAGENPGAGADHAMASPRVVVPAPERAVVDGRWDTLVKAGGRTADAAALGVLGADGLHLPNCRPVPVELPESVDQVVPLMDAYGLKTLYLHASAVRALGLPAYDRRKPGGRTAPVAHAWATPAEGGPVLRVVQGGLVPWMTLETTDGRRLSLAIPEYEDRMDKRVRHGFSGPTESAVLLDALMVYLLSTQHGTAGKPKVVPYYMSPNKTGEDYAGGLYRDDVTSQAVRRGEVKPLSMNLPSVLKLQWDRAPEAAERDAKWLHQYDKSAAWLAAWGSTPLGIGEPEHYLAERDGDLPEIPRDTPGLWRVSNPPGSGLPGLPDFRFEPDENGGFWIRSTPALKVVWDIYPDWVPDVLEAYYWPVKKRALHGAYELLSKGRVRILADLDAGRPGAEWALGANGAVYKSFRGYLERKKPKRDHVTGEIYERDIYWRPDWAWALMDAALASTFYNVRKYAEDGMFPLTVYVDAVTYASDKADPLAARPTSMPLGRTKGGWKPEGSAPMGELLPLIDGDQDQPGLDARNALREYLRGEH
ncbi:DUF927 domain-containing protein [Kitasatospora sp. NPDC051170]|uniref:DUF927 domain-containing protein n=1 Tax=Kitasatospora sp. NPDC051170 TaxID=3364056 RepID=UPI0037920BB9